VRKVFHFLDHSTENDLTPDAMLDFVTQTPSRSHSQNVTDIQNELDHLDQRILVNGPDRAPGVKERADHIRAYLETRIYPNWDEVRAYVRALEILRDTCSETPEEFALRRAQAWTAVCYYRHIREIPGCARALESFANICRMLGEKRRYDQITRWAYNLLAGRPDGRRSLRESLVFHQILALDVRSCSEGYADSKIHQKSRRLSDLTEMINTPIIQMQALQEVSASYRMGEEYEEAADALAKLDSVAGRMSLSPFYRLTTLRSKIEFYIEREPDAAVDLIRRDFLEAYRASPRTYHLKNLERWAEDLHFKLPSDLPPSYDSPMLFYVPRGEL
jgi:hypothetical protein